MTGAPIPEAYEDGPVLIAVVNDPQDFARARDCGWYRIPLARAPQRVAADYLAFYLTGAFPPSDRWCVRWLARVRGYAIVTRRELIPEEADHPRAGDRYHRIALGPLEPLPRPVCSRRLRRITFIHTTLARLLAAEEINDLWVKSAAQERLWAALKQEGLDAERQYPLEEELPQYVADFALFCRDGAIAVVFDDEPVTDGALHEQPPADYLLAAGGWSPVRLSCAAVEADAQAIASRLANLAAQLGGPAAPPFDPGAAGPYLMEAI